MILRLMRIPVLRLLLFALVAAHPFMAGAAQGAMPGSEMRMEFVAAASPLASSSSGHRFCQGKLCLDAATPAPEPVMAPPRLRSIFYNCGISFCEEAVRFADTPPPRRIRT